MSVQAILLDPGHGGRDPGAGGSGFWEKDIVLGLARRIGAGLTAQYDCAVYYTRETDVFLPLSARARQATGIRANLLVSLHVNAFTTPAPNGYEDFLRPRFSEEEDRMRMAFHSAVAPVWTKYGRVDRGRKTANFTVLNQARTPAILAENGFVTNPRDAELLRDGVFMAELMAAHVLGIAGATGLKRKEGGG